MRLIFFFTFFGLLLPVPEKNIPWSETEKLSWSSFRAKAPKLHFGEALTSYQIGVNVEFTSNNRVEYFVFCHFEEHKSWVKPGNSDNDYLLNHEQRHFDLAEYHARTLRKALRQPVKMSDIGAHMKKIHGSVMKECAAAQILYDKETNHSIDRKAQLRWNAHIDSTLQATEEYTDSRFEVELL